MCLAQNRRRFYDLYWFSNFYCKFNSLILCTDKLSIWTTSYYMFRFFLIGLGCFSVSLISNVIDDPRTFDYKSTISTDEFNIDKYNEVKSAIDENNVKVSYTYKIKNTDNTKTVSTENGNVYSISVLNSSNRVNHLTVKHNSYFNWATFTTTQKDEYVFSSK